MVKKSFYYDGKRYYITAKTEAEANEKLVRKKIQLEEGRNTISRNTFCKEWFAEWLETYKKPSVSPGWAYTIKVIVNSVISPEIGNLRLKDVKPIHIQKVLNGKADMSDSYLHLIYVIMAEAFRIARKNGLIYESPVDAVSMPKGRPANQRRAITARERKYILQTCEVHRAGLFYKIMLYCGCRPAEVAALQWRNIDLDRRILTVDSAIKADGTVGPPKSKSGNRCIPIPAALVPDLQKARSGNPFDLVCTNAHGGQLTKSSLKQQWKSFLRQLNIEMGCRTFRGALVPPYPVADDLVPYCLRHTYCTDLQAAGVPINVARELMGHSDISITSKIYTHSSRESIADAALAIDSLQARRDAEPGPRDDVDICSESV